MNTAIQIPAAYTSQTCYKCGHCEKDNRKSQSKFVCLKCHHSENADLNAAQNILTAGLRSLGISSLEATSQRFARWWSNH